MYGIRAAAPADLPRVLQLLENAALPVAGVPEAFEHFLVAENDDTRIIGAAGLELHGNAALLRSVVVAPDYRGRGCGVQLVEHALRQARARRLDAVYLLTTTAAPFFDRLGFAQPSRAEVPNELHASVEFREACPAS